MRPLSASRGITTVDDTVEGITRGVDEDSGREAAFVSMAIAMVPYRFLSEAAVVDFMLVEEKLTVAAEG